MKNRLLIAIALLLPTAASAQQQTDILGQLLGSVFGTNQQASEQTLESDWNEGRRPFEQRRDQLDMRIDTAVRDGSLSPGDAEQMRREYNEIVRIEAQYAADGNVSQQQRNDLRMRYRALTQRVGSSNSATNVDGRWQPLATRNAAFEQQISNELRNRTLTQAEANRLRTDWRALAQIEANYQNGGLSAREQADLWARYNAIADRLDSRASGFGTDRNTARWSAMDTRLATAERAGRISRNDAIAVRAQLGDLARLDAAYSNGGYSSDHRSYLTRRYAEIDTAIGVTRR